VRSSRFFAAAGTLRCLGWFDRDDALDRAVRLWRFWKTKGRIRNNVDPLAAADGR
jgi:hypothetical protein